jgi:hypothetical protein
MVMKIQVPERCANTPRHGKSESKSPLQEQPNLPSSSNLVPLPSYSEWLQLVNRATDGSPRLVCCTPEEARELADLVRWDRALYEGALRHLREVRRQWR